MEQSIVKKGNVTTFLERSVESIESMQQAAELILQSRLAPDHFYEKGKDGKVDYSQGNVAKVMLVAAKGAQLGVDTMNALQNIVPINGLLTIKGDLAKSLIFSSGVLEPGSWKEEYSGSLKDGTYRVTITATRRDNKLTLSRTFSVAHAKLAGLWVDDQKLKGKDGWRYRHSPWVKYPQRMIYYRCLSYLARDLFSDVLSGMYVYEEAQDIPKEETTIVEVGENKSLTIPDKEFAEERSHQLANNTMKKINQKADQDIASAPFMEKEEIMDPDFEPDPKQEEVEESVPKQESRKYTDEGLKLFTTDMLMDIVKTDEGMKRAIELIPGRNTNKKLRGIILAWQDNVLEDYVSAKAGRDFSMNPEPEPESEVVVTNDAGEAFGMPNLSEKKVEEAFEEERLEVKEDTVKEKVASTPIDEVTKEEAAQANIPNNENKFGITVTPLQDESRPFEEAKELYEDMANVAGIDNNVFQSLSEKESLSFLKKYKGRDDFCFHASADEVLALFNAV